MNIAKNYEKRLYEKADKELILIASENYCSQDVLDASGSLFQLFYAEGFPYKRYYQGTEVVDDMEQDCINKVLKLFNADEEYLANVQPNSGASANMIVYNAVLEPNDTVLAMDVKAGGHISHSHPKSFLAKYHKVYTYGVDENGLLDYDKIEDFAMTVKPKLIVCGASNYSQEIDFQRFRNIADKVGAKLMADIAHISLLVAHGLHQTPVGLADFITFTTHKCMKGARGAVILYKSEYDKIIKLSTIPSLFGGSLEHQIYAKLVCFNEALTEKSKEYARNIIINASKMAETFAKHNIPLVSNGTQNHLMTIDLTNFNISGKELAELLEECGIVANCNSVPNDKRSFLETSGVRLGTPAITARGLKVEEVENLTEKIAQLILCYQTNTLNLVDWTIAMNDLKEIVQILVEKYPLSNLYPRLYKEFLNQ